MPGSAQLHLERAAGLWLRAGAVAFALILIGAGQQPVPRVLLLTGAVVLLLFLIWRGLPRLGADAELGLVLRLEPALALLVVLMTGGWASPFGLYLAIPLLLVALAAPRAAVALLVAIVALLTMHELVDAEPAVSSEITGDLVPMVVATVVGVVGRRLESPADAQYSRTLGRIQELSHVNALLSTLYDLVRSNPAPLTVEDVLGVIKAELDELFDADAIILLLSDEGGRWWRPVHAEGVTLSGEVPYTDLPAVLTEMGPTTRPIQLVDLPAGGGLTPRAKSGVYLWLWSRGQASGLLAMEHNHRHELESVQLDMLDRVSAPLSLALDNAIWFRRLRTLGAEEERQRIGAQLHDRFAQSLVYVAGELDRAAKRHADDESLRRLHRDVRDTLADLRETLRDLRLRCTDEQGLVPTLQISLERFGDRFGLQTSLEVAEGLGRPPLPIENQLLRIAQDLAALAQRESAATVLTVRLVSEAGRLRMVVSDDGRGIPEDQLQSEAARVLSGVRDRASAIGGLVDVFSRPGEGTEIAVTVRGIL